MRLGSPDAGRSLALPDDFPAFLYELLFVRWMDGRLNKCRSALPILGCLLLFLSEKAIKDRHVDNCFDRCVTTLVWRGSLVLLRSQLILQVLT